MTVHQTSYVHVSDTDSLHVRVADTSTEGRTSLCFEASDGSKDVTFFAPAALLITLLRQAADEIEAQQRSKSVCGQPGDGWTCQRPPMHDLECSPYSDAARAFVRSVA